MKKIFLVDVKTASINRLPGYEQEILKRGTVVGGIVQLSDSDYEYISKNFRLGLKAEKKVEKKDVAFFAESKDSHNSTSAQEKQKTEFKKDSEI